MLPSRTSSFVGSKRSTTTAAITRPHTPADEAYSLPRTISYNTFTPPNEPSSSIPTPTIPHSALGLGAGSAGAGAGASAYRIARSLSPDPLRSNRDTTTYRAYTSRYDPEEDDPFILGKKEIEQSSYPYDVRDRINSDMPAGVTTPLLGSESVSIESPRLGGLRFHRSQETLSGVSKVEAAQAVW